MGSHSWEMEPCGSMHTARAKEKEQHWQGLLDGAYPAGTARDRGNSILEKDLEAHVRNGQKAQEISMAQT